MRDLWEILQNIFKTQLRITSYGKAHKAVHSNYDILSKFWQNFQHNFEEKMLKRQIYYKPKWESHAWQKGIDSNAFKSEFLAFHIISSIIYDKIYTSLAEMGEKFKCNKIHMRIIYHDKDAIKHIVITKDNVHSD